MRGLERFQDRYTLSALLRGRRSLGSRRLECIPFGYGNPETAIKPVLSFQTAYGTSKLVPLRTSTSHRTFSAGCKLVPLRTSTSHRTFSAGCKVVPLRTSTSHRTFSAGCKVVPFQSLFMQPVLELAEAGAGVVEVVVLLGEAEAEQVFSAAVSFAFGPEEG